MSEHELDNIFLKMFIIILSFTQNKIIITIHALYYDSNKNLIKIDRILKKQ